MFPAVRGWAEVMLTALLLCCGYALADDGLTPDQKRMRSCNTQATEKQLKGPQRSHFMTGCLNGTEVRKLTAHQQMNESCTREADARKLDGAARRGFMSDCVKPDRVKQQAAERTKVRNCHRRAAQRRLDGADKEKFVAGCLDGSSVVGG